MSELKRQARAWILYDWASSAFATTVMAAVLPNVPELIPIRNDLSSSQRSRRRIKDPPSFVAELRQQRQLEKCTLEPPVGLQFFPFVDEAKIL